MEAYSEQDKKIYEWLEGLFSTYNIDCCDEEDIIDLYDSFDDIAGTNTMEVLREDKYWWFEEE